MSHLYIAVERLNITTNQFEQMLQTLKEWVLYTTGYPPYVYHKRTRLDGDALIAEGYFNGLTIAGFRQALADEFSVDVSEITVNENSIVIDIYPSPIWTFVYNSSNRFRASVFAGPSATSDMSHHEALYYLTAHIEEWQTQ